MIRKIITTSSQHKGESSIESKALCIYIYKRNRQIWHLTAASEALPDQPNPSDWTWPTQRVADSLGQEKLGIKVLKI